MILTRGPKLCNFVEWKGFKVVYKRYIMQFFVCAKDMNALLIVIIGNNTLTSINVSVFYLSDMQASTFVCVLIRKTMNWRFLKSFIILLRFLIVTLEV